MDASTLDRLEALDPIHYSEGEVFGLLDIEPRRIEAWEVRGAIGWHLKIPAPPDGATPDQAKLWRAGWQAAAVHASGAMLDLVRSRSGDPEARVVYMAHPSHPDEPITPGAGWVCYAGGVLPAAGIAATARDALLMALDAFPVTP